MSTIFAILALLLMLFSALSLLCLAQKKHFNQVFNHEAKPSILTVLRSTGWLLLALSLLIAMYVWSFGIALVAWFGALTLMQAALVIVFAYYANALKRSAVISLILAVIAGISAVTVPASF